MDLFVILVLIVLILSVIEDFIIQGKRDWNVTMRIVTIVWILMSYL